MYVFRGHVGDEVVCAIHYNIHAREQWCYYNNVIIIVIIISIIIL